MSERADRIAGVILGTAVGDALGLPREGLSPRRARRLFGAPLRHRFVLGRGMTSDDTEHTCLLAQALLRQPHDAGRFARALGWGLRFWLLGLPAGLGRATLYGGVRLWLGFSPERSGLSSPATGPPMRSALLGVCLGHDPEKLRAFVRAATRLTHRDPRAERGARLIAVAAHHAATHRPEEVRYETILPLLRAAVPDADPELTALLGKLEEHLRRAASAAELVQALSLRRGVSGYIYHTVPVALCSWLRAPGDYRRALEEVIALGGDTDTTGAITGALVGATVGAAGIPHDWIDGLCEWPRSVRWMRRLASRLAERFPEGEEASAPGPLPLFWPGLIPRNILFFLLVLAHVLRRLLPPY